MPAHLSKLRIVAILALAALALAVAPAAAGANAAQESIFQDDGLTLFAGDQQRDATLDEMRALGADTVRAFVYWDSVAPEATSTQRPPGFDATNPASYPADLWNRFDGLVRAARARGLSLILTPTSPAPAWASQCRGSSRARQSCWPRPSEFGAFMRALGTRYSGAYRDEDQGGETLPRVSRWGLWNEPNVGRWLTPQYVRRGGRLVAASPAHYRRLALAAIRALRATGHRRSQILLGETAPIGHTGGPISRRPIATAAFWRNLLCLDTHGRPLRGRAARDQACPRRFPRLLATAISHHPYVRGGSRSPRTRPRRDEVTIANLSRLTRILDQGARRGRLRRGLRVYYTEFGFQTNPPDRTLGVSLRRQALYLNQSEWMAYRQSRVRGMAQYLMRDDVGTGGFQSGLKFADGGLKPSYGAYRFPIWVVRRGVFVTVFGQVRHARPGASGVVRVQVRLPRRGWATYRTVRPNRKGFVLTKLWSKRGSWRLVWEPAGGPTEISRVATEATR